MKWSTRRRSVVAAAATLAAIGWLLLAGGSGAAESVPARLEDQEFWSLVNELSEPGGYSRSDNFLSNEIGFQRQILDLLDRSLIPAAPDSEMKALLATQRATMEAHLDHANHVQTALAP